MKRWKTVTVFHDGDSFFDALVNEINRATYSVSLESYIFSNDALGQRVLGVLAQAVSRGVAVRLIIDGLGSNAWKESIRKQALEAGILLKVFHELPWYTWYNFSRRKIPRRARRQTIARLFQRLNTRDHRKVCIIDNKRAFLGSMNVIEYHVQSLVGTAGWRDTGVLVEGAEVSILVDSFNNLWRKQRSRFGERRGMYSDPAQDLIRLNVRHRQRRENYLDLLVRIVGAQRRVWIENAYFVPDGSLLRVLRVAAESGVDVKIVVPAFSDVVFIPWVASAFHLGLLRAGVRVFEYTKTVLHAKTMLIDDWGLVGSSNLNHRSLLHDLEVDAVITEPAGCKALQDQFEADIGDSIEVTLETWRKRPRIERIIGRLLLAIRHVL